MKKIKHLMIWMGLLLCLVSCKDAMETIGLGGDEIPAEGVTLNIELPNFSEKKIDTRAGSTESIGNVTAVFYGESNTYKGMANVKIGNKNTDGTYPATISNVPSGTKTVHLVTNLSNLEETEAKNLQDIASATPRTIDTSSPVCWGCVSLTELLDGTATANLLRQYAKVTLKVDDAINTVFPEKDAGLIINHAAAKSAIAPAGYTEPTDALAETAEFSSTDFGDGISREVAVTETSAGVANVIIKAKYNGVEGYYKVGLYNDGNKTSQFALLRNHNYTITVTKVNAPGFKTKEEAIKAKPENRIEAQIVDDNPTITKMIACKDYELGVSDKVYVDAEATSATITVVTTLNEATSSDGSFYTVTRGDKDSWIHTNPIVVKTNTNDGTNHSTQGKKYVLTFTIDKNDNQEESRTGTITVSSGDLTLTAQIIQKGYDFKRDDQRPVTLWDGSNKLTDDYFTWLDKVQGITPKEMHDGDVEVVRNEGLHFSPVNNTYSYLIKKLDGDSYENSDTRFTVEDNGSGYWKVTLNSNDNTLWKSSFNIKHSARVKITYDVYHTGIFHQISNTDNQMAEDGETSSLVKGWFYYEVVKVKGNSGKTYLMLDRNLGASNNGPYIRETKALEGNEKAIGGYFYIATDKNNNLSSTLSPSGYEIPKMEVFEDLINVSDPTIHKPTIQVVTKKTPSGETYSCAEIKTTDDSQLSYIYLPYGGYLENEVLRNPIHVDLWTQTPLSGTQGFASTSPDYGFWYKYFDIYNKSLNFSNVRFVSGSDGKNTGRYKAMPLRLISKTVL